MRVAKYLDGKPSKNLPKILVTEPDGHDELVDFLSVYQTQDRMGGTHYHPEGALCWYACNKYGDPTGRVIYIRKVPIKSLMWSFGRKREFRLKNFNKTVKFKDLFLSERRCEDYTTIRPCLYQPPQRGLIRQGKHKKGKR